MFAMGLNVNRNGEYMNKLDLQMFAFDENAYCDFESVSAKAIAGKDIIVAIFNNAGDTLLALAGQQGLTINRSADTIEVSSKDTNGGWKAKIAGLKEWSIDTDGLYVTNDESHKLLGQAFENSMPVCVKVINGKTKKGMFGGLAAVTEYSVEAPFDDATTYSITLEGMGKLTDLSITTVTNEAMPGTGAQ